MKGPVFSPAVGVDVDDDGDLTLEIIWPDRRLLLSINPSQVGTAEPHGWCYVGSRAGIAMQTGIDLASLAGPLYDLARWQVEHDEHRSHEERAAEVASIDTLRAKTLPEAPAP